MNIVMLDTVEDACETTAETVQHPVGQSGVLAPFSHHERKFGDVTIVTCQYRLARDATYMVAERQGKRLVDGGFAKAA